ncbi:MAG: DNA-processing protein DprA [Ruminococcus sp.]|jgi:DNA processing protein
MRIDRENDRWPQRLVGLKGMPKTLYYRGRLPDDDEKTVAIVGARMCSQYGKQQAFYFGKVLAEAGVSVISGMARGVDGCAHAGALEAGGSTYAVLGCGLDICYPPSNRHLYEKIPENGGVITEFPMGSRPLGKHFPMRNRVISALADIVLVIEAKERSGSLITADFALEQGKDVYALPGRVGDALSEGCNRLIAQGAGIALDPEMLLETMGIQRENKKSMEKKTKMGLATDMDLVYSCVDLQPKELHRILEEVSLPAERTMEILLKLQLDGKVLEVFRNCYVKV